MVGRKGIVYRVWEDIEMVVKEKDENEYDEREDAELDGSTDLSRHQYRDGMSTVGRTILRVIFGQA